MFAQRGRRTSVADPLSFERESRVRRDIQTSQLEEGGKLQVPKLLLSCLVSLHRFAKNYRFISYYHNSVVL